MTDNEIRYGTSAYLNELLCRDTDWSRGHLAILLEEAMGWAFAQGASERLCEEMRDAFWNTLRLGKETGDGD